MDERGQRIEISAIQLSCNISLSEQNTVTSLQKKGKEKKTMFFYFFQLLFGTMCLCTYVFAFFIFTII